MTKHMSKKKKQRCFASFLVALAKFFQDNCDYKNLEAAYKDFENEQ